MKRYINDQTLALFKPPPLPKEVLDKALEEEELCRNARWNTKTFHVKEWFEPRAVYSSMTQAMRANSREDLALELTSEHPGASFSYPLATEANGTMEMKSFGNVFNALGARFCPGCQTTHREPIDLGSHHGKTLVICLLCDKTFCCLERLKEHGRNMHHGLDIQEIEL